MKIFSAEQIREIDRFTIENEPIASIDLMERAAAACAERIAKLTIPGENIWVFCGKGNNGGDGLAITRLLLDRGFHAKAIVIHYTDTFSADAGQNYERLKGKSPAQVMDVEESGEIASINLNKNSLVIDALLGTGLSKPVEGLLGEVISLLNSSKCRVISIDIPSGLYVDKCSGKHPHIVHSTLCLTFQVPKLSFLLPENAIYVPEFEILDIGLSEKKLRETASTNYYLTHSSITSLIKILSKLFVWAQRSAA